MNIDETINKTKEDANKAGDLAKAFMGASENLMGISIKIFLYSMVCGQGLEGLKESGDLETFYIMKEKLRGMAEMLKDASENITEKINKA